MPDAIWDRWNLPGLDPDDSPHPTDDGLERRFWQPRHYAILIYTEVPREQWRAQCSLARNPREVANALAGIERLGVDRAIVKARITEWEQNADAQARHRRRIKRRGRVSGI